MLFLYMRVLKYICNTGDVVFIFLTKIQKNVKFTFRVVITESLMIILCFI